MRLRNRTILLVEDQFLIRMDLEFVLEAEGATVIAAPNVARGLDALEAGEFDLAILDVHLPDGDVFPVARAACERGLPIVFHSGHAEAADLSGRFPNARLLSKPARDSDVIAAALDQMAAPATLQEGRRA